MFETKLEELELSEATQLAGIDPFEIRDRLLIRAWKGRCCFDLGEPVKCFETEIAIREGRHKGLELAANLRILGLKVTTTYEIERTITYNCGPCDSVEPLLVFDDAFVHLWEVRTRLLAGLWKRNETVFIPTSRPFIASNKVRDDPECDCESASPPQAGPDDQVTLAVEELVTRLISTTTVTPTPVETEAPAPTEIVSQALVALQGALQPLQSQRSEQVGVQDMHGGTTWFSGPAVDDQAPRPVILNTDCNAHLRQRLEVGEEDGHLRLLAAAPTGQARTGRLRLFVEQDGRLVPYEELEMAVEGDDGIALAWADVDIAGFRGGVSGEIELELMDSVGSPVCESLIEEFVVITRPAFSGIAAPQPAYT